MGYNLPHRYSNYGSSYEDDYVKDNYADKLSGVFRDKASISLNEQVALQRKLMEDQYQENKEHEEYAEEFIKDLFGSDKKTVTKKDTKMAIEQFLTLDIGSNKATIDLSQVRKQGLVFEKTMFGKKPKIMIFYKDRPDTPEVNFELNSEEEARSVYNSITKKLDRWAEESNSARLLILQEELEIMREQKEAQKEEIEVLMSVFNQFKEMMQIMEDDTKTSSLVETIKAL